VTAEFHRHRGIDELAGDGITRCLLHDRLGSVYSHRHPEGFWPPGGASNVGGECLEREFRSEDFSVLDEKASTLTLTGMLAYPLGRAGEATPRPEMAERCGFAYGRFLTALRERGYLPGPPARGDTR
jgi:hypothetical protein